MPPGRKKDPQIPTHRPKPAQPGQHPPSSIQRKLLLILTMLVLGLPVLVVIVGPPIAGGWILWQQIAQYRQDGKWRAFSFFELATHTIDRQFSEELGWPGLSSCGEIESSRKSAEKTKGSSPKRGAETPKTPCPDLSPPQAWLLSPEFPSGWHRNLARVLRAIPVSSLLFLLGLCTAYLFQLIGRK